MWHFLTTRLPVEPASKLKPSLHARAGRLAWGMSRIYLVVLLVLLFFENALIYPARKFPAGDWDSFDSKEDIFFASEDGTKLHGWLLRHPQPQAVVLYHHGNGEHVADNDLRLQELRDRFQITIFAYDYRGYGRSDGKPHEAGVLADGRAAQRWLAQHLGLPPQAIVMHGRSLGGAMAIDCAATNGCRGLIVESSFSSLPDVAALQYPFFPVRWVMRNRLDSTTKIASYDGPYLHIHGHRDQIVPISIGERLFAAAKSAQKKFWAVAGRGHNDVQVLDFSVPLAEFYAGLTAAAK